MDSAEVQPSRLKQLLHRRGLWLAGALVLAGLGGWVWHGRFGKPKVTYATVAVTRGDLESTVVAAGVLQPIA